VSISVIVCLFVCVCVCVHLSLVSFRANLSWFSTGEHGQKLTSKNHKNCAVSQDRCFSIRMRYKSSVLSLELRVHVPICVRTITAELNDV